MLKHKIYINVQQTKNNENKLILFTHVEWFSSRRLPWKLPYGLSFIEPSWALFLTPFLLHVMNEKWSMVNKFHIIWMKCMVMNEF